ncbi:MAG: galactokinase [Pseudomonadota bacterium]
MTIDPTILADLRRQFAETHGSAEGIRIARVPGRVNLLGEHTDYNDGFVLPMTIDRAVTYALRPRDDRMVVLHSLNFSQHLRFPLDEPPMTEPGEWTSYVVGAIQELRQRGLLPGGFEGVVTGDVPLGGGLSSSAALEVATVVGLQALFGFDLDPAEAAKLCQLVEHRYAGVQCGIMDQFAARLGRQGHALFLDCRTLDNDHIPLALDDTRVVIVNTGVKRALASSKYNERRAECDQAVAHFQRIDPAVRALRDVTPAMLETHGAGLTDTVRMRSHHIVHENRRVLDAITALREHDLATFGRLMNESHASLRDLYEVSCAELDALAEIGQSTPGVLGARMTGAGFGGCTVHLAQAAAVEPLTQTILQTYPARFNLEPTIHVLSTNFEAGEIAG